MAPYNGTPYDSDWLPPRGTGGSLYRTERLWRCGIFKQFKKALETHAMLATVYKLRNDFGEIIYSKNPNGLQGWICKLRVLNIAELNTYANGISKDTEAVKNGIILAYNNDLAEGSMNKIKVVKRIMYGRNSFD